MQESHPFPVQSLFFKTLYNCEGSQVRSKPWAFKRALADRLHAQVMCWIHPGLPWQPPLFFFIQRKIVLSVNVPFHRVPWLLFRGLTALRSKRWAGPGISIITDPHCSPMLFILQLWVYQHLVSPPLLWVLGKKLSLPYCMSHVISDSGLSALLFYSQETQFSVWMFSCPFPLISESSWSSFSRFCFAVALLPLGAIRLVLFHVHITGSSLVI